MSLNRWAGVLGILAVVLLILAFNITSAPEGFAPDDEWMRYIEDDSGKAIARAYALLFGSLCLIAFYSMGLAPSLPGDSAGDRALRSISLASVVLAACAFTVGGMVGGATSFALEFFDTPVDPAIANTLDKLGLTMILLAGTIAMGAVMGVVAIQSLRTATPARWVGWLSAVSSIGMLGAVFFLPFLLLAVWVLALSVHLLLKKG